MHVEKTRIDLRSNSEQCDQVLSQKTGGIPNIGEKRFLRMKSWPGTGQSL